MLSDEEIKDREKELDAMEEKIVQQAEVQSEPAALVPSPEPVISSTSDSPPPPAPVAHEITSEVKPEDDPMKWAEAKGFKTPEDMARALLQKERQFHESRQNKPPVPIPPQPWKTEPEWRPQPDMGGYPPSYPAAPNRSGFQDLAAMYPQIDPEDLKRFMPVVIDVADSIARRSTMELKRQVDGINRTTQRNEEMMTLMQDPAFRDSRVQKEIHAVLDADPSIFHRERAPYAYAYEKAMVNIARQKLQQGANPEIASGNMPPPTAGGGNGSRFTGPVRITEREFNSWSIQDQEAYLNSNGKIIPKK